MPKPHRPPIESMIQFIGERMISKNGAQNFAHPSRARHQTMADDSTRRHSKKQASSERSNKATVIPIQSSATAMASSPPIRVFCAIRPRTKRRRRTAPATDYLLFIDPRSASGSRASLSITDTRYADTGTGTAIRRFLKNKDTPIRQVYIFLKM